MRAPIFFNQQTDARRAAVLAARARQMRLIPTESEERLFDALRASKLGVRFHRQVPIAKFIVDFLAPAVGLVVEVDGGYHAQRAAADARRDRALLRAGYRVLRLEAELVLRKLPEAVTRVRRELEALGVVV